MMIWNLRFIRVFGFFILVYYVGGVIFIIIFCGFYYEVGGSVSVGFVFLFFRGVLFYLMFYL